MNTVMTPRFVGGSEIDGKAVIADIKGHSWA
jgi:hypothetical protein